ncbi:MAG: T9SS type A sorting domain-containing protein [Aureispira sp.]|nr:T9SS type A sorting domain-containing protein [Aureispira sp.]
MQFILLIISSCFLYSLTTGITGTGIIDSNNLDNYANQTVPNYITKDNTPIGNEITDEGATLGRVLFYDKKLSLDNSTACASCHQQQFAFGDTATASIGIAGTTGRHSMRLINSRFSDEDHFFWDERADSLEMQSTMPIQDHIEMGFSGGNGDPAIDSLIRKLVKIDYYNDLFTLAYGDTVVTEHRMQKALAQFIRSIQSFDSKYDIGRNAVPNDNTPFANYTQQENLGKQLFFAPPAAGGAGCDVCHRAPEFDIDPNTLNNGIIGSIGGGIDLTNTRAPSLRDLFNTSGVQNGPFMHTGAVSTLQGVINHYNLVIVDPNNTNLDPRLVVPGPGQPQGQNLQLTQNEKNALEAFLKTLSGSDVYTNLKWSDPFDASGNLAIVGLTTSVEEVEDVEEVVEISVYPNPTNGLLTINGIKDNHLVRIVDMKGALHRSFELYADETINLGFLNSGVYFIQLINQQTQKVHIEKIIKQ